MVETTKLTTISDRRGALTELFRGDWGQINLVEVAPGATRGGHRHNNTNEIWVFLYGQGHVCIEGAVSGGVVELDVSRGSRIVIDAGVGHAIRNTGPETLVFVYYMDRQYNKENPDKESWLVEELFT